MKSETLSLKNTKMFNVRTAKEFFNAIPTELQANIEFRIALHKQLCNDVELQDMFLSMCKEYVPILFNTVFFTFNPKKRYNHPFILRPKQIEVVETLHSCIQDGIDAGINKSRDEGASEICCKLFVANCILYSMNHFIVGSRKMDYVDKSGDNTTLFAKIDNAVDCLPTWLRERLGYDKTINRKSMLIEFPRTNSAIVGETTNENFSAGSRATALLLDEIGRVDMSVAESIEGSVHDVSDCVIYSSTHWLGINHTFNKALKKSSTKIVELLWYDNPEKNKGLYASPEPGKLELLDDFYTKDELTNAIYLNTIEEYDLEAKHPQFILDGCKSLPPGVRLVRSPWQDFQEYKRKSNKRDWICNVWACPIGASDAPFDANLLEEIRRKLIRSPDIEGELCWTSVGLVSIADSVRLDTYAGQRRLKWWGELPFGRPNQRHNYVIGIDPSYGLGSANSAVVIVDVNTKEQVGSWTDSNTKPEQLADFVVALAYWIGGVTDPFLIWESNAGCGRAFEERIIYNKYYNAYTQRREDSKTRKKTNKWGWASTPTTKENLLGEFGVALNASIYRDIDELCVIIHDEHLLDELSDYVFKDKGKGIVASAHADLSTGATERHGDRGIACALCLLAMKEQAKGKVEDIKNAPFGSFAYYDLKRQQELAENSRHLRRWLY